MTGVDDHTDTETDHDGNRPYAGRPSERPSERPSGPWGLDTDRRAGAFMQAIAVCGVIVTLVVTTIVWTFLSDLDRNLDQSLVIGEDAAASLVDTIDVAAEVIGNLDAGLDTLDRTLVTVASTSGDTGEVASSAADIAGRLPDSFDQIDTALAQVESLSGTVDSALRAASRIPLGPDYDPDTSLPDAVGEVRATLSPVGDDLGALSSSLDGFADGTGELATDLGAVRDDLDRTRASLDASDALLQRYRDTAERAELLARSGRSDFGTSLGWTRFAVLLLAAFVVIVQFVPWYVGRRIRF